MSTDRTPAAVMPVPDRVPAVSELLRADDIERCLKPFLVGAIDGVLLFDRDGAVHGGATADDAPIARWEQLPAEAEDAIRRGPTASFGMDDHVYEVRPAYAGTERVGLLVVSRRAADADERDLAMADALTGVLTQLLQAGFATWVTSEMHLAASQSHYAALTQQNAELERAVAHLREIDKLKSNFLATVSHELRTPLTSVIGFAEMLLEGLAGELNEEQTEYVQTILNRGEELLQLISQVLEMSQLEVGRVRLDLRPRALPAIAARAIETVQLAASEAKIDIVCQLDGVPQVLADAEKLQRVLVNLVGNAIKFSRPGGKIAVQAELAPIRRPFAEETLFGEEANDAVRITVSDTGKGIAPEQLGRIFEAFYQVDASPTREHGGAGLGLSIVRNLVQAHGGEVWADSEVGVGTAIHFTLPIAAPTAVVG